MSCRLPGAGSAGEFWQLLREGRDAITETPAERWAMYGLSGPDESLPGLHRGGYLDEVDRFDPGFFGISPREAAVMDPQQRLMLELCWEALEDAGVPAERLARGQAGVFVGAISSDYAELLDRAGFQTLTRDAFTGNQRGIIANRVSYFLGLRGPSLTVDTGQSSGLVAVYLACESLLSGESSFALAGGVNLNLGPHGAISLARFGALSPDGRCFTFDARANGFVRGEGGGVVALKTLERAIGDGDHVYCVIRGGALNNDGGGDGLAAPDQEAQEELLRLAYERAGVEPRDVQYVELHGTGTKLGDRVEAGALGMTLGSARADTEPVSVGSAKTNVGHLEGAAGIVGLIKAALCVNRREIPPSLNFKEPDPEIPLEALRLRVQETLSGWPRMDRPLVAGVSSFGVGGTNCHLVLEQAPEDDRTAAAGELPDGVPSLGVVPWVISAKSRSGLAAQARRLMSHLQDDPDLRPGDVGYSLATARSAFEHRAVVLGESRGRLLEGLELLDDGSPAPNVVEGVADPCAGQVVFLFPGQGSQWMGMGVELMERSRVFETHIRACIDALAPYIDFSVHGVLRGDPGQPELTRVDVVQPTLFAVMVSLARLWESVGVHPSAVVGHSQGEIAAAHVAGGLSLEDAARVVALRSRALASVAGRGGMMSVALSPDQLMERFGELGERVSLAAINGPASVVVSGDLEALQELLEQCEAADIRARTIPVDYASHSPHVEAVHEELLRVLAPIAPRSGEVPLYSTLSGGLIDTAEMDPEYWYRGLRQTVQFERVVRELVLEGFDAFLEVSAHPVLTMGVQETVDEQSTYPGGVAVLGTLRRDDGGPDRFMTSLAVLHGHGVRVDWEALFAGSGAKRVALPTYAFERERYWFEGSLPPPRETVERVAAAEEVERGEVIEPTGSFAARIAELTEADREQAVLDLVLSQVALVLGHASAEALDARRAFKELGFDSPAAVELRNRLAAATGLKLPAALVFDHPSPVAVRDFLVGEIIGVQRERGQAAVSVLEVDEPLAIVGMACRFPGGVSSPEELWRLIESGVDAIGEFPTDRGWDLDGLYDPDPDHPGTSYTRNGGFVDGVAEFDADHFSISPREALAMDPQQRLLLEVAWEALEDAGIDPLALRGTPTGVFAGAYDSDYGALRAGSGELEGLRMTGSYLSVISGRIAYALGFEGPAVSVDTACSSSLVALHLACQALRLGECSLALAGGVSVIANPSLFVDLSRQRALSSDGRCRAFGAGADGTGFSDGVGMVLVERLSDARRNGHRVLALVRGSAVNQDGASNGLTAPNGPSQERVIRRALAVAGLEPGDVDAVEAHGTGTALGDPIEAGALLATYGQGRSDGPLYLGSVKSNLGHTQAAAGVAGVIKMVLALGHGQLPKTLWADEPSPHVDWSTGRVSLLSEPVAWPAGGRPRRAGVSSFGISGTNAHLILEEAPPVEPAADFQDREPVLELDGGVLPFSVSGSSEAAMRAQAGRLRGFLSQRSDADLPAMAAGLGLGRAALSHRAVALASRREDLLSLLGSLELGEEADGVLEGVARAGGRVAFVFPGQGSQWVGMGVELMERSRVFETHMRTCIDALAPYIDFSLEDVLRGAPGAPALDRVEVIHPALFAVMVSLARLWESVGVRPDVVVGHSLGEIAAAHVAGGLSLEDAARVVVLRSQALATVAGGDGAMLSVGLSADQLTERLGELDERLCLGVVNGPGSVVLSGDRNALEELLARCEAEDIRAREIADVASHSPYMAAIREQLLEALAPIAPHTGTMPLCSTVTGGLVDTAELDAEHWYRGVSQTVLFDRAVRALVRDGYRTFIEISPHPVLAVAVHGIAEEESEDPSQISVLETLRRDDGGVGRFLASVAEAHVRGVQVDWGALLDRRAASGVELPTYAFQHRRYWLEARDGAGDVNAVGLSADTHPLLGAVVALADADGALFTGRVSLDAHRWLADHAAMGTVLLPGAAFLELALHAAAHTGCGRVEELTVSAPLVLEERRAVQLQMSVSGPDEEDRRELTIYSRPEGGSNGEPPEWVQHASGVLGAGGDPGVSGFTAAPWPPDGAEQLEGEYLYDRLAEAGYEYGPNFQGLRAAYRADGGLFAEVGLGDDQRSAAAGFRLHPALCDAALQAAALRALESDRVSGPLVPFVFSDVRLHQEGAAALRVRVSGNPQAAELVATDESGMPVFSIGSLELRPIDPARLRAGNQLALDGLYGLRWAEVTTSLGDGHSPGVAVLGDERDPVALDATRYLRLEALEEALAGGAPVPELVLAEISPPADGGLAETVQKLTEQALELLQAWLASDRLAESKLVLLTRRAVAAREGERPDLRVAALPGLLRSAHSEHPDRFALVDLDGSEGSQSSLAQALVCAEPEVAVRDGVLYAPRVARIDACERLLPPADASAWRLAVGSPGMLESLALADSPGALAPLGPGQVRVAVHAAGLNFHDVVVALGLIPGDSEIGSEAAGVVVEAASDVSDISPGDRVLGLIPDCFGPLAVAERLRLAKVPEGWSFAQAASVPAVFLTAYHGLVDLARLKRGEAVLIHGAAGGVGMAAGQLARHLGAEVFATAHPDKWETLRGLGLDDAHIASSRSTEFKDKFLAASGGRGVDVVLGSLAGEMVDSSLELMPRGGRYVEMGKTDLRDPDAIAAEHPGVSYQSFDLLGIESEHIAEMLAEILRLFASGALEHLPLTMFDVGRGDEAFRFMRGSRHTGKIVLRVPQPLDPAGTVLITGGTGGLGALEAKHLAARHGARQLLLASRRGPDAPGATELAAELQELGCAVEIAACDASDREQLERLLAEIPPERPLTAVVHTAGVLDDGVISSLDTERLRRVMAPKVDAAVNLHELTKHHELREFILYSSVAATLGSAGQGNYAAANTFLDALAQVRHASGLPATSLAFGVWERATGMSGHLTHSDKLSQTDSLSAGLMELLPLGDEEGLELIDTARALDQPLLLPIRFNQAGLRARAKENALPAIMSELVRAPGRKSPKEGSSLATLLAGAPESERDEVALQLVLTHVAALLGYESSEGIEKDRPFRELGFDSLSSLQLRNRISQATGLNLPTTLTFDYPAPGAVAKLLRETVEGADGLPSTARPSPPAPISTGATPVAQSRQAKPEIRSGWRGSAKKRPLPMRAIRRLAINTYTTTGIRRLYPIRLSFPLIEAYARSCERRGAAHWRENQRFYQELLRYTPLAGTEGDVARRSIVEFFRGMEMFWRPWVMTRGEIEGLEHFEAARSEGRGVVAVTSHFGNPYAQVPIMARYGVDDFWIIVSPHLFQEDQENNFATRRTRQWRKYLDLLGTDHTIARSDGTPGEDAFTRAVRLLRDGATVSLAFDNVGTLPTPFLGRRLMLSAGPAELALAADAMVAPFVHSVRGHFPMLRFAPPLDPRDFDGPGSLQVSIVAVMEKWALERPQAVWPLEGQPGGPPLINGPPLESALRPERTEEPRYEPSHGA